MHTVHLRGIDIGTSGLKCVLIDDAGQLRALTFREYAPDLLQEIEFWFNKQCATTMMLLPRLSSNMSGSGQPRMDEQQLPPTR